MQFFTYRNYLLPYGEIVLADGSVTAKTSGEGYRMECVLN